MVKKLIIFCLMFMSYVSYSQDIGGQWYVAPPDSGGSDSNPGTYAEPFASFQKAIDMVDVGDTVYFRGGVYYTNTIAADPSGRHGTARGASGTQDSFICYFAYPGEEPIFDFSIMTYPPGMDNEWRTGVYFVFTNFIHFRDLTFRNVYQYRHYVQVTGIFQYGAIHAKYELVTVHNMGGAAFKHYTGWTPDSTEWDQIHGDDPHIPTDSVWFINCDAFNNADTFALNTSHDTIGGYSGGSADGFFGASSWTGYLHAEGCRAWNNSDDGFDFTGPHLSVYKNNWSFQNGYFQGDGTGFKLGSIDYSNLFDIYYDPDFIHEYVYNNISAYNSGNAYQPYEGMGGVRNNGRVYNNSSYRDGWFTMHKALPFDLPVRQHYYNNIAYETASEVTGDIVVSATGRPTVSNNSFYYWEGNGWYTDPQWSLGDDDFVSLDVEQLKAPRKADGSLPDITFMRLTEESLLKGAGIYYGMSATPDIGVDWAWYDAEQSIDSTATDITDFLIIGQVGSSVINTTNHTVAVTMPFGTDASNLTPTISVSSGATILPPSGTWNNFTSPAQYTVTALDGETEQIWTVTVTVEEDEEEPATPGGRVFIQGIKYNGSLIKP